VIRERRGQRTRTGDHDTKPDVVVDIVVAGIVVKAAGDTEERLVEEERPAPRCPGPSACRSSLPSGASQGYGLYKLRVHSLTLPLMSCAPQGLARRGNDPTALVVSSFDAE